MAMTLEQVRDRLASWYGGSEACLDAKACAELGYMIAAIDAHLTQPAQAVDVKVTGWLPSQRAVEVRFADTLPAWVCEPGASVTISPAPPSTSPTTGAIGENGNG